MTNYSIRGYSDSRHPFEGKLYCVHSGHLLPVGNEKLATLMGGYIVDTLKFSGTLFKGREFLYLKKGSFQVYHLKYMVICD